MKMSHHLNLDHAPSLTCCPFKNEFLSNARCTCFMCLASIYIYIDPWKSFVEFGIKKSHEMISYILVGMALLSVGIAPLIEWNYRSSTKPCNFAQLALDELYNKSHERSMLSKCPENAPIGHKDHLSFSVILLWSKQNYRFCACFGV